MRRLPFILCLALTACEQAPRQSMADITAACDDQFGAGTASSAECQLEIVTREVANDRDRRMSAAEAAAR